MNTHIVNTVTQRGYIYIYIYNNHTKYLIFRTDTICFTLKNRHSQGLVLYRRPTKMNYCFDLRYISLR